MHRLPWTAALLLVLLAPSHAQSQEPQPFSVQEIEEFVRGGIPTSRILTQVREFGLGFTLTPAIEARLRTAGADEELVAGLRPVSYAELEGLVRTGMHTDSILVEIRARRFAFSLTEEQLSSIRALRDDQSLLDGLRRLGGLPAQQTAVTRPTPPPTTSAQGQPAPESAPVPRTREQLRREVYFGDGMVFRVFAGSPSLDWKSNGAEAPLGDAMSWGIALSGSRLGFGLEGQFITNRGGERDFDVYNLGLSLEPFLPIGESRIRVIAGGVAGAFLYEENFTSSGPGGETTFRTRALGAALDARAGLAYHLSRGFFVFADATYRWGIAVSSWTYDGSGMEIGSETWPDLSLSLRGLILRAGFGF